MTATDKKRRKLAMEIGESFTAIRRRMLRSAAWLSLGGPAIKIFLELKIRFRRYKGGGNNNGSLFVSHDECRTLLRLPKATAHRGFLELEAKGFIFKTRQGEAGALPSSGTLDHGGVTYARRATTWALTDEPYRGEATHAYEKWTPPETPKRRKTGSWFHQRNSMVPSMEPSSGYGSTSGTVEPGISDLDGSTHGTPLSTIYTPQPERPWHAPTYRVIPNSSQRARSGNRSSKTASAPIPPAPKTAVPPKTRAPRNTASFWPAGPRRAANLTQQRLADLAGMRREYLAIIEQGRRNPGPEIRAAIARALSRTGGGGDATT